jgi:hypothetical protein
MGKEYVGLGLCERGEISRFIFVMKKAAEKPPHHSIAQDQGSSAARLNGGAGRASNPRIAIAPSAPNTNETLSMGRRSRLAILNNVMASPPIYGSPINVPHASLVPEKNWLRIEIELTISAAAFLSVRIRWRT